MCSTIFKKSGFRGRSIEILTTLLLAVTSAGCGSLFYQPARERVFFDPDRLGVFPEEVWTTAEDGVKIHSWYLDADPVAKPKAIVLFFHGNAENLTSHYSTLLWLLPHGIDFWIMDYRGYGQSEGRPTPMAGPRRAVCFRPQANGLRI